jgi:polyisoprenoid-binding protein YceI
MKKILIGLLFISFGAYAQTRYELPAKSKLKWKGETILSAGHEGTLEFQSGYILVDGKTIARGEFNINMNSMFSLDEQTGTDIESLTEHLKSDDFFSVEKFPNAYFSIASVVPTKTPGQYEVNGFLTIKGIINPITFNADMVIADALVALKAEFTFDRLLWNITYQSKNFLNDLKDTAIADNIQIKLDLVLDKK